MTTDEQVQALIKQNDELIKALNKAQSKETPTAKVSYSRETTYRSEPSLLDKLGDAAIFGVGFSVADNIIDSLFD